MRTFLIAAALLIAPASAHAASPGAAGIGDRLFPKLGNGGYDVAHYDVALNYATAAPAQGIDGTVTIQAKATQALSRFDLDFAGDGVGSVSVNGQPAKFSRSGQELVITPATPLPKGTSFAVTVADYTSHPKQPSGSNILDNAFIVTPDGSATLAEPSGAHVFLPSNDHPRDKATFTFHLDVPAGETAVANGELTSQTTADGRTLYVYDERAPMATYLIQLAVGSYKVVDRGVRDGVHFRDLISPSLEPQLAGKLPLEVDQLAWLKTRLGAYPFTTYGSFVIDVALGASLETQTLSIFDRQVFRPGAFVIWPTTMLHEASHQWMGDSVSPSAWSDVWLNEGHATWYEMSYAAGHGGVKPAALGVSDTVEGAMKYFYEHGDDYRRMMGPVAKPTGGDFSQLFSSEQYFGGALVLYALRRQAATRRSGRSSARGCAATRAGRPRPRTSSSSRRGSPTGTCTRSCATGSTAPGPRRCRATATGRSSRSSSRGRRAGQTRRPRGRSEEERADEARGALVERADRLGGELVGLHARRGHRLHRAGLVRALLDPQHLDAAAHVEQEGVVTLAALGLERHVPRVRGRVVRARAGDPVVADLADVAGVADVHQAQSLAVPAGAEHRPLDLEVVGRAAGLGVGRLRRVDERMEGVKRFHPVRRGQR
jgi:hypothetical protein